MKVTFNPVVTVVEVPPRNSTNSKSAAIDRISQHSDAVPNHMHAQRLQARMTAAEIPKPSALEHARTVAYKAALVSGALSLATIACAFFIKNGWAIPVGFAGACVLLFCAAGKRTQEIEAMSQEMAKKSKEPCPV